MRPIASNRLELASAPLKVSSLAGTWYDGNAKRLARTIDSALESADAEFRDFVGALILPHAGYTYSGSTAARGLRAVQGQRYRRIIVLGPSHRLHLPHQIALPDFAAIETPLGGIKLDIPALRCLAKRREFTVCPAAFEGEHSVEIQLPLLQRALGSFELVPLIVGQLNAADAAGIAPALLEITPTDTLVVVSSDFTHYGDAFGFRPFGHPIADNIHRLDEGAFDAIARRDAAGFLEYCIRTGATICGRDAIAVLLSMLPEDAVVRRIAYTTSGAMTGDYSHCVSYLSAACFLPSGWRQPRSEASTAKGASLIEKDRKNLLKIARQAIDFFFQHHRPPASVDPDFELSPALERKSGAFVTLYLPEHRLRGCIGEIMPQRPLYKAVGENAVQAAFRDPRFQPLSPREWKDVAIEISVLTPPQPVSSLREIEIGKHGIILSKGHAVAVFLPQVAVEQQWTLEQTLAALSRKAGLPSDAWQSGVDFAVFEAEIIR